MHFGDVGGRRRPCRCRSPRSAHRRPRSRAGRRSRGQRRIELGRDGRDRLAGFAHVRLSPTHRMTPRPAASAASALARTSASLSCCASRRSEWPTMVRRRAGIEQHRRRDAAGVRALLGEMDVLARRSRSPARPAPRARSGSPAGTRRHRPRHSCRDASAIACDLGEIGRDAVHLPIAGDQLASAPFDLPCPARPSHVARERKRAALMRASAAPKAAANFLLDRNIQCLLPSAACRNRRSASIIMALFVLAILASSRWATSPTSAPATASAAAARRWPRSAARRSPTATCARRCSAG